MSTNLFTAQILATHFTNLTDIETLPKRLEGLRGKGLSSEEIAFFSSTLTLVPELLYLYSKKINSEVSNDCAGNSQRNTCVSA